MSKQYSREMIKQDPFLGELLDRLGLQFLHDLDPKKLYITNLQTKKVRISTPEIEASVIPNHITDNSGTITTNGGSIIGQAKASVYCAFGGQMASVRGFMSTQQQRDPNQPNIREGFLSTDTDTQSVAEVNFSLFKQPGGARNISNRTVMQTTHQTICNGEAFTTNYVTTWPPIRFEMVIDDTGSMSEELGGLQFALADIINANLPRPDQTKKISYELISFKDEPTLKLANTEDTTAVINAVNALSASGGADCPEDSVGALNLALDNLTNDEERSGGIVFATDASPSSRKIDEVISRANSLGVKVNVMLTGDCVDSAASLSTTTVTPTALSASVLSAREVFQRVANETGGLYFYRPGGTVNDYKEILTKIFETSLSAGGSDNSGAPVVTVTATPTVIWPPNHEWVYIDAHATASDDKDPNPVIKLVGVTMSEPNDGQGDGNTKADYKITLDGKIYVRAERSGTGNDRFYTIAYQATDNEGKIGFGSVDILVPHNQ